MKRIAALLLSLCLLVTMLPMAAATESGQFEIYGTSLPLLTPDAAEADLLATGDCLLAVALYDADGKMLDLAATAVTGSTARQTCTVKFAANRPEQVLAKAFLLDGTTYTPLCGSVMLDRTNPQENAYAINGIRVEDGSITAVISTSDACTLTLEVLTEDGDVLFTERTEAGEQLQMADVTVSTAEQLPAYFLVRAALQDGQGNNLCSPYTTMAYTAAYEKFMAQTPEDFPGKEVLDFGENGFGVLVDNVIVVDGTASTADNTAYTFPCSAPPQPGDVLLLTESDGVQTPVKVKSVTINGDGTVTILRDENATLSDLYQTLKLDALIDVGAADQTGGEVQLLSGSIDEDGFELIDIQKELTAGPLTVSAKARVGLTVAAHYDAKLFGKDYFDFETNVNVSGFATATVTGAVSSEDFETPPQLVLREGLIGVVGTGLAWIDLDVIIPLDFSFEGTGTASIRLSTKTGFRYDTNNGYQPFRVHEPDSEFELEGTFRITTGLEITLEADVLHDILEGTVNASAGIVAEGAAFVKAPQPSGEAYHACTGCCDISISLYVDATGTLDYHITDTLSGNLLSLNLLSKVWSLGDFYFSFLNEEDSVHKGSPAFGENQCPNYQYLLTVKTEDLYGKEISGVPIDVQKDGSSKGSGQSPYEVYLYSGSYTASAEFDSARFDASFDLADGPYTLTIQEEQTQIHGTVTDALTQEPIAGAQVVCTRTDGVTATHTTDEKGWYVCSVFPGVYTVQITADGRQPWTSEEIVMKAGKAHTQNAAMQPEYYTVSFDANGGSGSMADIQVRYDEALVLPGCTFTAPEEKVFRAWQLNGREYAAGSEYAPVSAPLTFLAVWKDKPVPVTVTVLNPDGTPAADVAVQGTGLPEDPVTGSDGSVVIELEKDVYTLHANQSDYYASQTITVTEAMAVTLTLQEPYMEWTYDEETETLTITGCGPMPDYHESYPRAPWADKDIQTVNIYGLSTIGTNAFYRTSLTSVTIPESVTHILDGAFSCCYYLTSITIPESVTYIGRSFENCSDLTWVTLPESVSTMLPAFKNCTSLITAGPIGGGYNIEYGWTTSLPSNAFGSASSLTYVKLPEDIASIDGVFIDCTSLTDVSIPECVTSMDGAFKGCTSLTDIVIPEGVTSMDSAFYGCTRLSKITIPESVTSIGKSAFYNCTSLTEVTLPQTLTSIDNSAFFNCSSLTTIQLPASLSSIGSSTFRNCTSLTRVTLPESLVSIGQFVFQNCTGLTSAGPIDGGYNIEFGWTTTIPCNTFYGANALTSITFPDLVTTIEGNAFNGCTNLSSIELPLSLLSIGNRAFANCTNLISVVIPERVASIGPYVFEGCTKLTHVTIPASVSSISYAFEDCAGLQTAGPVGGAYNIQFGWTSAIPGNAFSGANYLTSITFPDGITTIAGSVFQNCTNLTSITIPEGVTSIGQMAFSGCTKLTSVTIPASVVSFGWTPFYQCSALTSAGPIGSGSSIEFGWSGNIPANAFGSSYLTSVSIPDSITSVGSYAFYSCSYLTTVYYEGTEEQWNAISVQSGNDALTSAAVHYNCEF